MAMFFHAIQRSVSTILRRSFSTDVEKMSTLNYYKWTGGTSKLSADQLKNIERARLNNKDIEDLDREYNETGIKNMAAEYIQLKQINEPNDYSDGLPLLTKEELIDLARSYGRAFCYKKLYRNQ